LQQRQYAIVFRESVIEALVITHKFQTPVYHFDFVVLTITI